MEMTTMAMYESDAAERWTRWWRDVGNKSWLAARELIQLSPALLREAQTWVRSATPTLGQDASAGAELADPAPEFDWQGWLRDYDARGRGWSSTEHRLFAVTAALLDEERPLLLHTLRGLGTWETRVWHVLLAWAAGEPMPGRTAVG